MLDRQESIRGNGRQHQALLAGQIIDETVARSGIDAVRSLTQAANLNGRVLGETLEKHSIVLVTPSKIEEWFAHRVNDSDRLHGNAFACSVAHRHRDVAVRLVLVES